MDSACVDAYLRALGVAQVEHARPSLATLQRMVRQHFLRLPFENVGMLKWLAIDGEGLDRWTVRRWLDDIEQADHGGTCMLIAPYFADLLTTLGWDASLWLADIQSPLDPEPYHDFHAVVGVAIDGVEHLVELGFGTPLFDPIEVSSGEPRTYRHGDIAYRYAPGPEPRSVEMRSRRGDKPLYRYLVRRAPRRAEEFLARIVAPRYRPGKLKFLNCLNVVRFFEDRTLEIRDRRLLTTERGRTVTREIADRDDLRAIVAGDMGLPRLPVDAALEALRTRAGVELFGG